jgi:anti-anti-sigma factor
MLPITPGTKLGHVPRSREGVRRPPAIRELTAMSHRPSVEMTIISERTAVLTMFGEHDLSTRDQVLEALGCAQQWTNVLVDLTPCEFLDSSVIGVLFTAQHAPEAACERFALILPDVAGLVDRTIDLMGVRDLIPTHTSIEDALRSLDEPEPIRG